MAEYLSGVFLFLSKESEVNSGVKKNPYVSLNKLWSVGAILLIVLIWQVICMSGLVESFLLPSPIQVIKAFFADFFILVQHTRVTLLESIIGLLVGILFGFIMAVLMDRFQIIYMAFYPLIVLSQTIPTVAIAPLLVLWFGYEMLPKVILIVLTTFFPIAVGLITGFRSVDPDTVNLMRSMGANRLQIFVYIKVPGALEHFFSGLKISTTYAVVGAVISEWIGGFEGLGVYMTRVKSAYAFDKMFAVIFLISILIFLS